VTTIANRERFAASYPELGTGPIPVEPYVSADYFARECETIFRRVWLNVGREHELPAPGDYRVIDIAAARTSILLVRDSAGAINGFHNMCSHRGNKVAWHERGRCELLTCSFHGWSYGLDGQLKHVPDADQFDELRVDELGLTPVAVETWEGFVFVNLSPRPERGLTDYLGELGTGMHGWPFAEKAACFGYRAELRCNWKLAVNAFQESYHVPFLHRRSFPDSAAGKANPLAHLLGLKLYPLHQTLSIYGNPEPRLKPVDELVMRLGYSYRKRVVAQSDLPPALNPSRREGWAFDANLFFPNFFVLVYGLGLYMTYNLWPEAVDRTTFEVRMYNTPPHTAGQRFALEFNRSSLKSIFCEDLIAIEQIQSVLASGAKTHFQLQDNEIAIRHLARTVDRLVSA
jgi:phenylpropionate dioxygenase-like ring-hydroxylating dioxygenase large terminal subunit